MAPRAEKTGKTGIRAAAWALSQAVRLADRLEPVHAADDNWPHGLGDLLAELQDGLDLCQARETGRFAQDQAPASQTRRRAEILRRARALGAVERAMVQLSASASAPADWLRLQASCRVVTRALRDCWALERPSGGCACAEAA